MKTKFCTNEFPGSNESKSLRGQNLAYATIGNGSINIIYKVSYTDSCEPQVILQYLKCKHCILRMSLIYMNYCLTYYN